MRTKPNFGKQGSSFEQDSDGVFSIILLMLGGCSIPWAIMKVAADSSFSFDDIICFGAQPLLWLIMFLSHRENIRNKKIIEKEKQAWLKSCICAETAIISRRGSPEAYYEDEYGIPHRRKSHYELTIRLPSQAVITIYLSQAVYEKLENRDTVSIYYQPEDPLTFLLEEEIA